MHNGVVVEYNLATKCNRLVGAFVQLPSAKEERQKKKKQNKKNKLTSALLRICIHRPPQKRTAHIFDHMLRIDWSFRFSFCASEQTKTDEEEPILQKHGKRVRPRRILFSFPFCFQQLTGYYKAIII